MPTVSAPSNTNKTAPQKPVDRNTPPQPMSSSTVPSNGGKATALLFVVATLILFGLLAFFIYKSANSSGLFKLDAPEISKLPDSTNQSNLEVKGSAPANSVITIKSKTTSTEVKADKNGDFSGIINLKKEGEYSFTATASKKFLFWERNSEESNTVSTTLDLSAPGITMPKLPKLTSKDKYTIKGSISEEAKVTAKVNDTETTVDTDKDGNFKIDIKLTEGKNKVTITAKDSANNETSTTETTITFSKGTVVTSDNDSNTSQANTGEDLPESAGILSDALNTVFTRYFIITMFGIGVLGYFASSNIIWFIKQYKK